MERGFGVFARLKSKTLLYHLALPTVLVLACLIAFFVFVPEETQQEVSVESSSVPAVFSLSFSSLMVSASPTNPQTNHPVIYPYSVIPGGIRSVEEFKNAIAHDPLLKTHYRGFNLAKARLVRLTKNREVHVSYRLGNRIYWTKKRLMLFKNETLISDGKNELRTRCGNRISDPPATPASRQEPSSEALDTPLEPLPIVPLLSSDGSPLAPQPIVLTPASPPGESTFIPPIFPIAPGGREPQPVGPQPTTPTPVPEPGPLFLLIATLPAGWLILKKRYISRAVTEPGLRIHN